MAEKKCFKCGTVKPLEQFYRHSMMGDGHLNKCIECARKDVSERENRLRANDPEWLDKERERCRIKQEKRRATGIEKDPEAIKRYQKNYHSKNKNKRRAQVIANRAHKKGLLKSPSACEACGATGVELEKHHPDYSKPLLVQWLCTKCHGITRRLRTAARAVEAAQQELFK